MTAHRYAILFCAAWIVGNWYGSRPGATYLPLPAALVCLILAVSLRKTPVLVVLLLGVSTLSLSTHYLHRWRQDRYAEYPNPPRSFHATIVEPPDVRAEKSLLTVRPLEPLGNGSDGQPAYGRILVHADRYPVFEYGDLIQVEGKIEPPEPFEGFNYPLFLEKNGVYGLVTQARVYLEKKRSRHDPYSLLIALRNRIERSINAALPEPESSFLSGLLLGSKRAIPAEIQEALRATGTTHIVAISGANITMTLSLLLRFLPLYTRRSQYLATVAIGAGISVLTGGSASVVRGAFVAGLGQYLRLHGRRAWVTPFILTSAVILLLINPLLLSADPGFQLSFAAYAGLLYGGNWVQRSLDRTWPFRKLPELVRAPLGETAAATLGTAPVSIPMFNQFSLLAFVVNPAILWVLPFITIVGFAYLMLAWLPIPLEIPAVLLWLPLHAILETISFFSRFTFAILQ